jgi:hypothetical protein
MNLLERRPTTRPMDDRPATTPSLDQPVGLRSPLLARSLVRTGARRRLEMELRAIAGDLLGGCQPGDLPSDCAEWLDATVDAAVRTSCESALAALTEILQSRLDAAPREVARRLEDAEVRHDAGYI